MNLIGALVLTHAAPEPQGLGSASTFPKPNQYGPKRTDPSQGIPKHAYSPFDNIGQPPPRQPVVGRNFLSERVVIKFKPEIQTRQSVSGATTDSTALNKSLADLGISDLEPVFSPAQLPPPRQALAAPGEAPKPDLSRWYRARVAKNIDVKEVVTKLNAEHSVEYAEPDFIRRPVGAPRTETGEGRAEANRSADGLVRSSALDQQASVYPLRARTGAADAGQRVTASQMSGTTWKSSLPTTGTGAALDALGNSIGSFPLPMNLPMNRQVGRVTPCAPQDRAWHPDGAHGVTRPTALNGFRGARREDLLRGILTPALSPGERENHRPSVRQAEAPHLVAAWDAVHPLPEGEGRGEGEQDIQNSPGFTFAANSSEIANPKSAIETSLLTSAPTAPSNSSAFHARSTALPSADTDPLYSNQWHLAACKIPEAWAWLEANGLQPGGNRDVVVAVIDTGVDYSHPDLTMLGSLKFCAGENFWFPAEITSVSTVIIDRNDNASLGLIDYAPTLTTPPETSYPFVAGVIVSTAATTNVASVGAEPATFTVTFNRNMDTTIQPQVSFGPDTPVTDYTVHPVNGGWQNPRT